MNDYEAEVQREHQREAAGLVQCDDPDCAAKDDPRTPEELRKAVEHWRKHRLHYGCSHGC